MYLRDIINSISRIRPFIQRPYIQQRKSMLLNFCRSPKRSVIHVTQHALRIIGIRCINRSFVLILNSLINILDSQRLHRTTTSLTESSKPIVRASVLTSSRSSSTDGSFVLLFSKCQRRGPIRVRGNESQVPTWRNSMSTYPS